MRRGPGPPPPGRGRFPGAGPPACQWVGGPEPDSDSVSPGSQALSPGHDMTCGQPGPKTRDSGRRRYHHEAPGWPGPGRLRRARVRPGWGPQRPAVRAGPADGLSRSTVSLPVSTVRVRVPGRGLGPGPPGRRPGPRPRRPAGAFLVRVKFIMTQTSPPGPGWPGPNVTRLLWQSPPAQSVPDITSSRGRRRTQAGRSLSVMGLRPATVTAGLWLPGHPFQKPIENVAYNSEQPHRFRVNFRLV